MVNIRTRTVYAILLVTSSFTFTILLPQATYSAGQYYHIFVADKSLDKLTDSDFKEILTGENRIIGEHGERDLFKFSALFPDTYLYDQKDCVRYDPEDPEKCVEYDGWNTSSGIIHGPDFFDKYAKEIVKECFTEIGPYGENSCDHRPDIACNGPLDFASCHVPQGSARVCEENPNQSCNDSSDCDGFFNNCLLGGWCSLDGSRCARGQLGQCLGGICGSKGVCSGDYQTPCIDFAGDCDVAGGICVDDYGRCRENKLTQRCERIVTQFMGALAHTITDTNFDNFFVHSIFERQDCITSNLGGVAQTIGDQNMDAELGRNATLGGQPTPFHEFLPTSEIHGRLGVEQTFLEEEVLRGTAPAEERVGSLLTKQWVSMSRKTTDEGETFDGLICSETHDDPDIIEDKLCHPGSGDCKVEPDGDYDGVCSIDFKTKCRRFEIPSDCPGLGNECVDDYGICSLLERRYRPNDWQACAWTIEQDRWYTQGGGANDTASEIARVLQKTWNYLRNQKIPKFRRVGSFGSRHWCVGTTDGPDCLDQKAVQIVGEIGERQAGPNDGNLSSWSTLKKVNTIKNDQGSSRLRFSVVGTFDSFLPTIGVQCSTLGNEVELHLNADSADTQAETERFTDILLTAFIRDLGVRARFDLAQCSNGGRYLVKDLLLEGMAVPLTANAGPDQELECTMPEGTIATLDGSGSTNSTDDPLNYLWSAPGIVFDDPFSVTPSATFPLGNTTATLSVSNSEETDTDDVDINVVDTTPPALICPDDLVIECSEPGGVSATHPDIVAFLNQASATDMCGVDPIVSNDAPGFFVVGDTPVTFMSTDAEGNTAECSALVTVQDTIAPTLELTLHPNWLWPPNHRLRRITANVSVADMCDPTSSFVLTNVVSSEPDNGKGDGNTVGDIRGHELGTADIRFKVRAERAKPGPGRVYTATYSASDVSGNTSVKSATVMVPNKQSRREKIKMCNLAYKAERSACKSQLNRKLRLQCYKEAAITKRECKKSG